MAKEEAARWKAGLLEAAENQLARWGGKALGCHEYGRVWFPRTHWLIQEMAQHCGHELRGETLSC